MCQVLFARSLKRLFIYANISLTREKSEGFFQNPLGKPLFPLIQSRCSGLLRLSSFGARPYAVYDSILVQNTPFRVESINYHYLNSLLLLLVVNIIHKTGVLGIGHENSHSTRIACSGNTLQVLLNKCYK